MLLRSVAIVAFNEFDNLGVGYLASVLSDQGFKCHLVDFGKDKKEILEELTGINPLVIGFSIIFQYHIYEFRELIDYLRKSGLSCHFTAGGQYASMRSRELFDLIPLLDSIVRFEGEYTFLELVNSIYNGNDWRNIFGLAFKKKDEIILNPSRPPEMNLDNFPFPARPPLKKYVFDKKFATMIAGRGCINNCSFCNNTEYLKQSSLPVKRLRKPEKVVDEIEYLAREGNCSVFLFEDDDFPVKVVNGDDWVTKFCKELRFRGLVGSILWKINCRPDEIDQDRFSMMKEHGLFLVFIGIDDGTDTGLKLLNKHMKVSDCLRGVNILKYLRINFDYGFMLFQPSSTFESLEQNLEFLEQLCSDGSTPVTFLKLRPYFDTKIERDLRKDGKLKGEPGFFDYDFPDRSFDGFFRHINELFMEWINDPEGLVNIVKWSKSYFSVFSHFYKTTPEILDLSEKVRNNIIQSNLFILNNLRELAAIFESGKYNNEKYGNLTVFRKRIKENHDYFKKQIGDSVKRLIHIAEYQKLELTFPYLLKISENSGSIK